MTTLRGNRAGNIYRKGGGLKARERTSSEPQRGLLRARRRRRQYHCSFSALPLSNTLGVRGEPQDFYNQAGMVVESRWRYEDACNRQRFSQLPGSFILVMILLFLTCSLRLVTVFSFILLQHLLVSSTFGIIIDEQELRPQPPPSPFCARPWSLRQMSRFNRQGFNKGSVYASSANPNYRLHPLTSYLQFHPNASVHVLPLWTMSSGSDGSKAALRLRFLFDKPNQRSPLPLRHHPPRFAFPLLARSSALLKINLLVTRTRFAGHPRGMTNTRNRGWQSTLVLEVVTTMTPFYLHPPWRFTPSSTIPDFPPKAF